LNQSFSFWAILFISGIPISESLITKSMPFYNLLLYQAFAVFLDGVDRKYYFNLKQESVPI